MSVFGSAVAQLVEYQELTGLNPLSLQCCVPTWLKIADLHVKQ